MTDIIDTLSGIAVICLLAFCAWCLVEAIEAGVRWIERKAGGE